VKEENIVVEPRRLRSDLKVHFDEKKKRKLSDRLRSPTIYTTTPQMKIEHSQPPNEENDEPFMR